ncbi:shTK domain protein [Cooperia oncophora]
MLFFIFFALLLLNAFPNEGVMAEEKKVEECNDRSRLCPQYKEEGNCVSKEKDKIELMKHNCKKTCDLCKK